MKSVQRTPQRSLAAHAQFVPKSSDPFGYQQEIETSERNQKWVILSLRILYLNACAQSNRNQDLLVLLGRD